MPLLLKKAMFLVDGSTTPIKVMFNPNEYSVSKRIKKSENKVPGTDDTEKQFLFGYNDRLNLKLFFDTYSTGLINSIKPEAIKEDVRNHTGKIYKLMDKDEHTHEPPKVTFAWGKFKFEGYIVSITQRFTMFSFNGIPVRAHLDLEMEGEEIVEKTESSPDRTKSHIVRENELLWQLADAEYSDAALWREIAEANGIDNPRLVRKATNLKIPSI